MLFDINVLIDILKNLNSPFIAYSCYKAKIEKPILLFLSYQLEELLLEEGDEDLLTLLECTYNSFFNRKGINLGKKRIDMVIANIDEPEIVYTVFEVKLCYSFDTHKRSIRKQILDDFERLKPIEFNLNKKKINKYFILFLIHYAKDNVDENIFAYGGGHNRQVKRNNRLHKELYKHAKKRLNSFFNEIVNEEIKIQVQGSYDVILGNFDRVDILLTSYLVEVLNET